MGSVAPWRRTARRPTNLQGATTWASTGAFRRLTDGSRTITVIGDDVRTMSGFEPRSHDEFEAVLADPTGWNELSGTSWFDSLGPVDRQPTIR